ncbi:unnamed protein product [Rhizophagus irregularis]|nr:unnamed protein product [Rhizophagus irregularis]CAB5308199.1 unnamed protein product [Rhizophagus irregularis]
MSATKKQLLVCLGICFVGFATSILVVTCFVMSSLQKLLSDISIANYAALYTIGNILFFISVLVLSKSIKGELSSGRSDDGNQNEPVTHKYPFFSKVCWSVVVICLTLAATLVIAFTVEDDVWCIILCIFQGMTLFWYCGGYILLDIYNKAVETYNKAQVAYTNAEICFKYINKIK